MFGTGVRCETTRWESAVVYAGRTFLLVTSLVVLQALDNFLTGGEREYILHAAPRSHIG